MSVSKSRQKIEDILSAADIQINGNRPWDMEVHIENLYPRLLAKASLLQSSLTTKMRLLKNPFYGKSLQLHEFATHLMLNSSEEGSNKQTFAERI